MYTPLIFDGRNCYKIKEVKEREVDYYSVGRKAVLNLEKQLEREREVAMAL